MSDLEDVRGALEAHLTAATGCAIPAASIAWKGRAFTPGTARWYRPTFMPGTPRAAAIGSEAANRHVCLFQVDVFDPPNKGENITAIEAERIAAAYKRGTVVTRNGQAVRCAKVTRGTADDSDPAWFKIPVIVEVWADVPN